MQEEGGAAGAGGGEERKLVTAGSEKQHDEGFVFETSEHIEVYDSFEHMELKGKILRGIYNYGFVKPSAV